MQQMRRMRPAGGPAMRMLARRPVYVLGQRGRRFQYEKEFTSPPRREVRMSGSVFLRNIARQRQAWLVVLQLCTSHYSSTRDHAGEAV